MGVPEPQRWGGVSARGAGGSGSMAPPCKTDPGSCSAPRGSPRNHLREEPPPPQHMPGTPQGPTEGGSPPAHPGGPSGITQWGGIPQESLEGGFPPQLPAHARDPPGINQGGRIPPSTPRGPPGMNRGGDPPQHTQGTPRDHSMGTDPLRDDLREDSPQPILHMQWTPQGSTEGGSPPE